MEHGYAPVLGAWGELAQRKMPLCMLGGKKATVLARRGPQGTHESW